MRLFVNENTVKAKASGAPPHTSLGELLALPQTPYDNNESNTQKLCLSVSFN